MRRDAVGEMVTAEPIPTVIEAVYRQHGQTVWRAVVAFSGSADIASDAVAEAFAQALRRGDAIQSPLAWIWRTAFRVAAGELQRPRRYDPEWVATGREAAYELPDPARDLVAALQQLSPRQRSATLLHHYTGYPVADVARILGSTPAAVRVHLRRGRSRLRTLWEATMNEPAVRLQALDDLPAPDLWDAIERRTVAETAVPYRARRPRRALLLVAAAASMVTTSMPMLAPVPTRGAALPPGPAPRAQGRRLLPLPAVGQRRDRRRRVGVGGWLTDQASASLVRLE